MAPSGDRWTFGAVDGTACVRGGDAEDFCLVVTRRRVADTRLELRGHAAVEWMAIAQAFTSPPSKGPGPITD